MGKCNLNKYEIISILLIIAAEILLFSGERVSSLLLHFLYLILILALIILKHSNKIIQSLSLVSLFRIVNYSLPVFFPSTIYWLASLYLIMFIPIILSIREQRLSKIAVGLGKNNYLLPVSVLIGGGLAFVEYGILIPDPLISRPVIPELFNLIILFIFLGFGEELLFRSLLLQNIEEKTGSTNGLFISSIIFGFMHSGYSNYYEIIFACFAGLIIGFCFQRTRNLLFAAITNGVRNIILFGILPFVF